VAAKIRFPKLKAWLQRMGAQATSDRPWLNDDLKRQALKLLRYQPIKEYDDPHYGPWRVMRAILQTWITQNPQPVIVMPVPLFHHVWGIADPTSYQARLREAATQAGGIFFDPLNDLMKYSLAERKLFYFSDGHLTREGHEALARSLAQRVELLLTTRAVSAS
jgi:hypothetical protein